MKKVLMVMMVFAACGLVGCASFSTGRQAGPIPCVYRFKMLSRQEDQARVDKSGKASFPVAIKEGQKYIHARAVKDNVTRHVRVNICNNEITDIPARSY